MQKFKWALAAVAAAATVVVMTACGSAPGGPTVDIASGTVIRNVNVVDTRTGAIASGRAVVYDRGAIQQVVADASVKLGANVRVIDGSGKYLVPAYLDMHTHSLPAAVFQKAPMWPMMISHGITGIREMAGAPPLIAAARGFNAARAAGTLDAPEVLQIPGPPIVGVVTAEAGVQAVMATKGMGGSFVKLVGAGPDALPVILKTARDQGLDVAGHLSPGGTALDMAKHGMKAVEHLGGIWSIALDCADDQAAIRADLVAGKGAKMPAPFPPTYPVSPFRFSAGDAPFVKRAMETYNATTCDSVTRSLAASSTWQVPTMIRLKTMTNSDAPEFVNDPNLKYVDPTTRALWKQLSSEFTALQPDTAPPVFRASYGQFMTALTLWHRNGGASKTLAGTDIGGIWVIPGVSLHQEFAELKKGGFTPLEVLQSTTINGARFLGREATMGTVEPGRNADLVLLDADPISDVANLARIAGVVNAGKYHDRAALDALKDGTARAAATAPLRNVSAVLDPTHKH